MLKLLKCEFIKLKRSKFLLIGMFGTLIVPLFVCVKAITSYLSNPDNEISVFLLYDNALMFLMLLFAPMILTILGAWIISREYTDGTLKNIYAVPVSQTKFLCGKLLFFAMLAFIFMLVSWLEIRTKGFVVPLISIVAIVLINVVLSNSGIAGFYPWSASYFLVIGRLSGHGCPKEVSLFIILIMSLLGITASLLRFKKEEVK